jgi:hypothetical protein
MRKYTEDDLQRQLFQWITLATPRIPQLALAFAVPNGGRRDAREAARMKGAGVRPGVPDIMIAHAQNSPDYFDPSINNPQHIGLAIELKSAKGVLTDSQKDWHERLRGAGWQVNVCRTFDEARQIIADYFGVKP